MNEFTLRPSKAARRMMCPGSAWMEYNYPSEETESAKEGILAHEIASKCLNLKGFGKTPRSKEEIKKVFGSLINNEAFEFGYEYAAYVTNFGTFGDNVCFVEQAVDISSIHPLCGGTPDAFILNDFTRHLHIFDYKYGHKYVEVFENWQLIEYAAGILNKIVGNTARWQVTFHIYQPRCFMADGPAHTWEISLDNLKPYFSKLKNAERLAAEPNALLKTSEQCYGCSARHVCPALQKAALETIQFTEAHTPIELTNESIGSELRLLLQQKKLLESRIDSLEVQAESKIKLGELIPHFTLQSASSPLVWKKSIEEVLMLSTLLNIDLKKPAEPITPTQAKKLGVPEEIMEQYAERISGKLKLQQISEKEIRRRFE